MSIFLNKTYCNIFKFDSWFSRNVLQFSTGFFKQKEELHKSSNLVENVMQKKKRSATMQHSARILFHITHTILNHKQTVVPTI